MKEKKQHSKRKLGVIAFLLLLGIIFYISMRGSYLEYKELGDNFKEFYSGFTMDL